MQSKVQTSDADSRKNFKAQIASKIAQATAPVFVSDTPVERVYILPHNHEELSEAGLYTTLIQNPDWKYTLDAAQFVVSILNGREPMPSYVSFELASAPVEEVKPMVRELNPTPKIDVEYITHTPVEVEKRMTIKAQIADKITNIEAPPLNQEAPIVAPVQVQIPVIIPVDFNTMSKSHLFGYLTHEQKLTPEQANDVLDRLFNGTSHPEFSIGLGGWAPKEEAPEPEPVPVKTLAIELPFNFNTLRNADKYLWLMKESKLGLTTEEANDVIEILQNRAQRSNTEFTLTFAESAPIVPVIIKASRSVIDEIKSLPTPYSIPELPNQFFTVGASEQYRILTDDLTLTPEHARFVMESFPEIESTSVPQPETSPAIIYVQLPHAFRSWEDRDRVAFLTKIKHLSISEAEDVLAHYAGKQTLSTVLMDWEAETDPEGRLIFKGQLMKRVENAKVPELKAVFTEKKALRIVEDTVDIAEFTPEQPSFALTLPDGFHQFKPYDKYIYLTRTLKIPMDDANAIIDGDPRFEITFTNDPTAPSVTTPLPTVVERIKGKSKGKTKIKVSLPAAYNSLSAGEQYWYLVKTKEMSYAEANDLLATLANKPTTSEYEFVVDWEE